MGTPELSLDFIPETVSRFLGEMTRIESESDEKRLKLEDLVSRFETEVNKIEAFKRELPLCMLLMNHGIVALKEELMVLKRSANQPVNRTVFEEFIPLKKRCDEERMVETDSGDKKNWLRSTQLWNSDQNRVSELSLTEQGMHNKIYKGQENVMVDDRYQYQYRDFGKELVDDDKGETLSSGLSLITPGFETPARGNKFLERICADNNMVSYAIPDVRSDIQIGTPQQPQPPHLQTSRKQRRCWSTELHRRFVNALQQLGGSKAATPKQIRELMNVDGLTNDEVKSHLQKYRLHTKRLSSNSSNVVMRGLWDQSHDHYAENHIHSQSGSPDGPLLNCTITTGGTSTTGGGSMDDGEDEKSETNCWKSYPYTSGKDDV